LAVARIIAACLTLFVLCFATTAQATVTSVVEIDDAASALLDAPGTRRLIRLELAEIDWDTAPAGPTPAQVLYFRVFVDPGGALLIELWDRGQFYGDRQVSAQGSELLRARRLALASAELARVAKRQQGIEQRRKKKQQARLNRPPSSLMLPATVRLVPSIQGAAIDGREALLIGPRLSGALVFHKGPRLDLGVGWQLGSARMPGSDSQLRWSEVFLAPSYAWKLEKSEIDLGLTVAASVVTLHDAPVAPNLRDTVHTWTSQLALLGRYHYQLSPTFRLQIGVDLGHTLRPIPISSTPGSEDLGGFWTALNLGGEITVAGRDR